jgi:hypothetical protein
MTLRKLLPPPHPLLVLLLPPVAAIIHRAARRFGFDLSADGYPLLDLGRFVDVDVRLVVGVSTITSACGSGRSQLTDGKAPDTTS